MANMLSSSRLAIFLMLASSSTVVAETVTLRSNDQQEFKLDKKIAEQSDMLEARFKKDGIEKPVEFKNIEGKTLARIVDILVGVPLRETLPKSFAEVSSILKAVDYLQLKNPLVVNTMVDILGEQIFDADIAWLRLLFAEMKEDKLRQEYERYVVNVFDEIPDALAKRIIERKLRSIDRVFLDNTPNRRLNAIESMTDTDDPLVVAQVIAYIAKYQVPSVKELPELLSTVLKDWLGDNFASKIHFGPWPTEFATWPGHCPLPSDPNYNMYSDNTPEDRFVDNGDGTVTDVCTFLTWQQASTEPMNWQSATTYCVGLNRQEDSEHGTKKKKTDQGSASKTLGFWRAPTRIELQSIVNYTTHNPALNAIFEGGNSVYWSSTPAVGYEGQQAWTVYFPAGQVLAEKTSDLYHMRCVYGEQVGEPAAGAMQHYTTTNDIVTDNFTGAVWQRRDSASPKTHADAKKYCTDGWTLPSVKELSTLVDVTRGSPRIDPGAFKGGGTGFWSSSPRVGNPVDAWGVVFSNGRVYHSHVGDGGRVRCVRLVRRDIDFLPFYLFFKRQEGENDDDKSL